MLWLPNKHVHAWHWWVLPVVDDRVQEVTLVSEKGVSSEPIHTKNILTAIEKQTIQAKNVAHISLLQWCCLGNRFYNSYIPPWGVVLHIGVGYVHPTPMCKTTTPVTEKQWRSHTRACPGTGPGNFVLGPGNNYFESGLKFIA